MAESKLPDWAYPSHLTDDPQIRDAAENMDNIDLSIVEVTGKFINNEPCKFRMDLSTESTNVCSIHDLSISLLRSSFLRKVTLPNDEVKHAVQISTKVGPDYIWFLVVFDTGDDTLKVLNICRKYLYSKGGCIDYLCPRWSGALEVEVTDLQNTSSGFKTQEYTIILDEEGLFLFRDFNKRVPDFFLLFCKESTDNSIERALVQHYTDSIVLESTRFKIVILQAMQHGAFTEAIRSIKPKPANIFQDHATIVAYVMNLADEALLDSDIRRDAPSRAISGSRNSNEYRDRSDTSEEQATSITDYWDQTDTAGKQATIIARELEQAMEALSVNEDLALPWIVAEDEIRQMIENPDVLGDSQTDMLSGGLDPNSPDHLMKSFSEIKEHLSYQRYEMALSRLKGTKVVFQESEVPEIKALIATDELQILKKLYFHSFYEG